MFARTKRLTLRPAWPEDAAALAHAIGHETVATMLARVPWPYRIEDAASFVAMTRPHGDLFCLVFAHDIGPDPRLIGGIGVHRVEGDAPWLGYWLTPAAWGRGYATEAGHAVVAMARDALGHRRLDAWHFVDNPASGRVLAKLGFRPLGRVEPRPSLARGGDAPSAAYTLALDIDEMTDGPMRLAA